MKKIKTSIIMPAYNTAPYIERALNSIKELSSSDYEIWVIDDGSEDDTLQVVRQFASKRENVNILSQENNGPAHARNNGLSHANGKYIYFMDSDDYIERGGIEELVKEMEQDQADVVVSGIYEEANGAVTEINYPACRFHSRQEYLDRAVSLWDTHLPYTMGNKLYRASFLQEHKIRFPEEYVFGEDTRFNMQVFALAQKISIVNKSYYHYVRERQGSTTTKYKDALFDIRNAEYEMFWNYFKQQNLLTEEGIEYLSRRHSERLSGCVVNLFLPGNGLSMKSRTDEIKRMCDDENTKYALRHAKLRSKKMKIILWPIKQDHAGLTYMIGAVVAFVQIRFPGLFIQLKAKR